MKDIKDILKTDGTVDYSKVVSKDGVVDKEYMEILSKDRPIIPSLSPDKMRSVMVKVNRDRVKEFPNRLPTYGIMPLPVDEHEHIGLYETKQNIYLTLAHAFNKAMERIDKLEEELNRQRVKS